MIFEPAVALTVGARLGRRMGVSEGLGPAAGVATAVVMAVAIFLGKSSLSMALECLRNHIEIILPSGNQTWLGNALDFCWKSSN
jgi:hypothetical protein